MPSAADQPTLGTPRHVVDLVVDLVARRSYRQARLQLALHEARYGLAEVAELIGQITAPPPGVDPRTEAQARLNAPDMLPSWLIGPVDEEIGRICARQSVRTPSTTHLIARVVAAEIVDESAPVHDEVGSFAARAHVDLREPAEEPGEPAAFVDVSGAGDVVWRAPAGEPPPGPPDRSLTDWLGRRI